MKKFSFLILFAFLSTGVFAQTTWTADKAHSQVSFDITHLGIAEISGWFREFDVNIVANDKDFSDAKFNATVDVSSIDTGIERRDNHLRSDDFFGVENNPQMTYKGSSVEKVGDNRYKVTGDLTLNGVTKPVTLEALFQGSVVHPQSKEELVGFKVTGTINRSDFNFGGGFPAPMLSDEVKIEFNGEFKKQS